MDKPQQLRDAVRKAYSAAAEIPSGEHPFPVGRRFAKSLGYPRDVLAGLPSISVDAFTGVSNVAILADIPQGARVLDVGCGAGLDSLVAAHRVGPSGRVIGVDFSEAMLARARRGAAGIGAYNVAFLHCDVEDLPVEDGFIDVAMANGIFNLNPTRKAIFRQLARVVRQGGVVYAAELVLREPLPAEIVESLDQWFA